MGIPLNRRQSAFGRGAFAFQCLRFPWLASKNRPILSQVFSGLMLRPLSLGCLLLLLLAVLLLAQAQVLLGGRVIGTAVPLPLPQLLLLPVFLDVPKLLRWLRDYLRYDSIRLDGWQESNLQFRFIQSRQ
ncbi:MAG: hypothetical protein LPH20_11530 [Shewanella sp.]|nr:hypothetical protein [Shewanella sp.]